MVTERLPAVAGTFYPAEPDRLRLMIEGMLDDARDPARADPAPVATPGPAPTPPPVAGPASGTSTQGLPRAVIAPHAGYPYSGPIAASAFVRLVPWAGQIRRVVLIGPSHRVGFAGLAVPSVDRFLTPLGPVPVDRAAVHAILADDSVIEFDEAHASEHALEVELPFLQVVLDRFSIVPIVVGDARGEDVARVLERLWSPDGPDADTTPLIVVSSDLSHFLSYARAHAIDEVTSNAILDLHPEWIGPDQACGRRAIQGLLHLARRHHLAPQRLDLRNSGDTAGPRDQVVGYGAWLFRRPSHEAPRGHARTDAAGVPTHHHPSNH